MTRDANDVLREHGVDALREAWDKAEVLRFEPKPSGQAPASERFPLVRFHDLRHSTSPACIVKGIVPRVGITAAWGPPKCGKSFAVYDLGMHVALGWEYRGRRVLSGAVVYFALEGGEGFKARADAYRQHHGIADDETVPFYLCTAPLNLVKEAGTLVDAIKQQLPDTSPRLVVIDTLNRSLPGSESRDEDMAAYLRAATMIVDAFKCAVIVIHHCGHDQTRMRGHSSLLGNVDAELSVKRDAASNVQVTVEHMKDGPEGDVLTSKLEHVEIGTDDDGDTISSCVAVEAEPAPATGKRKLSNAKSRALDALSNAIAEHGKRATASLQLPADVQVVSVDQWRAECFATGALKKDDKNSRATFKRFGDALAARKIIAERNGFLWIC